MLVSSTGRSQQLHYWSETVNFSSPSADRTEDGTYTMKSIVQKLACAVLFISSIGDAQRSLHDEPLAPPGVRIVLVGDSTVNNGGGDRKSTSLKSSHLGNS